MENKLEEKYCTTGQGFIIYPLFELIIILQSERLVVYFYDLDTMNMFEFPPLKQFSLLLFG